MQLTKVWQKRIEWEHWARMVTTPTQQAELKKAWAQYRAALDEEQKAHSLGD